MTSGLAIVVAGMTLAFALPAAAVPAASGTAPGSADAQPSAEAPGAKLDSAEAQRRLDALNARRDSFLATVSTLADPQSDGSLHRDGAALCRDYELLIKEREDFVVAYLHYASLLRAIGKEDRAVHVLASAIRVEPREPAPRQLLAAVLAEKGEFAPAVTLLLDAIAQAPGRAAYHFQLAETLSVFSEDIVSAGIYDAAALRDKMLEAYANAARIEPANRKYAFANARVRSLTPGVDPAATLALWDAYKPDPKDAFERGAVALHRAELLLRMGRKTEARAAAEGVSEPRLQATRRRLIERLSEAPTSPASTVIAPTGS